MNNIIIMSMINNIQKNKIIIKIIKKILKKCKSKKIKQYMITIILCFPRKIIIMKKIKVNEIINKIKILMIMRFQIIIIKKVQIIKIQINKMNLKKNKHQNFKKNNYKTSNFQFKLIRINLDIVRKIIKKIINKFKMDLIDFQ